MNLTIMGSTSTYFIRINQDIVFSVVNMTPNNCQIPSSSGTTSRKITDVGRLEGKVKVISRSQSRLVQNQKQNTGIRV